MTDKKLWSVHCVQVKSQWKFNQNIYGFIIIHLISTGKSGIYWFTYLFLLYQLRFLHILNFRQCNLTFIFWQESYVSLAVLLGLLLLQPLLLQILQPSLLLLEVLLLLCLDQCLQKFINKTLQGRKRLLLYSDPWPPAEQKLEMPCDN